MQYQAITQNTLMTKQPDYIKYALFGMGCFWGAEKLFWQQEGVLGTAVGYAGGVIANPSYEQVSTGNTQHTEVVLVAYHTRTLPFEKLLKLFWESHDPTQGMRQGNDIGSQYRSAIYSTTQQQLEAAITSKTIYQKQLTKHHYSTITTEIQPAPSFYFAEEYHQQYLKKNPDGYCGLKGTGVIYPLNNSL